MFLKFVAPSIASIRAQFIIEKLNQLSEDFPPISICATGRTGSGKTTLGNSWVGIDYFMPSTGLQDCTDEINLIEFPNGMKYSDLPGVASKGDLENYNRAALGIEQRVKLQSVQELTLAKYRVGSIPQKDIFSVAQFQESQILNPDLILYMIAADKQFLDVDCEYLGDLLSKYSNVIYGLNVFADKQTGSIFATKQNVRDVVNRIKDVHNFVLGESSNPIIVPLNCWTGSGISELIEKSHPVLGTEKGKLFEELINYQQQKTPSEYVHQVRNALAEIFAYISCQMPDGSYTPEQSIHLACYQLLEFLIDLKEQNKQILQSNFSDDWIVRTIDEALSPKTQIEDLNFHPSVEDTTSFYKNKIKSIESEVNILINSKLDEVCSNNAAETVENLFSFDLETSNTDIENLELEVQSQSDKYIPILEERLLLSNEIDSLYERVKVLLDERNILVEQFNFDFDKFKTNENELMPLINDVNYAVERYNSKAAKLEAQIIAYNSLYENLNSGRYTVSEEVLSSLYSKFDSIEREQESLERREEKLERNIEKRDRKIRSHEKDQDLLRQLEGKIDKQNKEITTERFKFEELEKKYIQKHNLAQHLFETLSRDLKSVAEKYKIYDDICEFSDAIYTIFNQEVDAIYTNINQQVDNINCKLAISENDNVTDTELENLCEELKTLKDGIYVLIKDLSLCFHKIFINKIISTLIMECTTHHFDNTDEVYEFKYKGSTYHKFGIKGISVPLAIAYIIVQDKDINLDFVNLERSIFNALQKFGDLPNDEKAVLKWLEPKLESLFDKSFDNFINQSIVYHNNGERSPFEETPEQLNESTKVSTIWEIFSIKSVPDSANLDEQISSTSGMWEIFSVPHLNEEVSSTVPNPRTSVEDVLFQQQDSETSYQ